MNEHTNAGWLLKCCWYQRCKREVTACDNLHRCLPPWSFVNRALLQVPISKNLQGLGQTHRPIPKVSRRRAKSRGVFSKYQFRRPWLTFQVFGQFSEWLPSQWQWDSFRYLGGNKIEGHPCLFWDQEAESCRESWHQANLDSLNVNARQYTWNYAHWKIFVVQYSASKFLNQSCQSDLFPLIPHHPKNSFSCFST